ncbi:MAG: FecR domain-containing protein [Polyangiaceae bacterium]|nr:FecR domain-containing protein [Polyangiaceae bacterium]MCW5790520.1 FecR domain-containing protein [Polyangiaceae bacterium]
MTDPRSQPSIDDHLVDLIEGTADEQVLDLVASSPAHRDARFEAEQAVILARQAGADFTLPTDFAARVLSALDAQQAAGAEPQSAEMPTLLNAPALTAEGAPVTERLPAVSHGQSPDPNTVSAAEASSAAEATSPAVAASGAAVASDASPGTTSTAEGATSDAPQGEKQASDAKPSAEPAAPISIATARKRRFAYAAAGLTGLAAAVGLTWIVSTQRATEEGPVADGWRGEVTELFGSGLSVCDKAGDCSAAKAGAALVPGASIRTDENTRVSLSLADGSQLTLDRSSELRLTPGQARSAQLLKGRLAADITPQADRARFALPEGHVEVLGTKFAITLADQAASVDVSRGSVKLTDQNGAEVVIGAGEQGRLYSGLPPYAATTTALAESLAWSDFTSQREQEEHDLRGLGELRAKKPGETDERKGAVRLTSHQLKVRIVGQIARTEIEEVFTNQTDEVLEGIFRFPLPPDAKIERLALDVDGKLEEGAFVERDRAAAIWRGTIANAAPKVRQQIREEIIWVPGPWRDPALLEWQRGGRFELRVFPIPKRSARRVVLAYSQVIKQSAGVRRYTYPLAHDPSGTTEVDRFSMDVQVRGHDGAFGVSTLGYPMEHEQGADQATRRSFERTSFKPAGDLVVEYALPDRDRELTAWTYKPSGDELAKQDASGGSYVAIALKPSLPRADASQHRDFVFVVDASRSMYGERYQRASDLTTRVIRELDSNDRVTVIACDTTCRGMNTGMLQPGMETAEAAKRFLEEKPPEGGSDVGGAVDAARRAAPRDGSRALRVVYIGDGAPTLGAIRPAFIEDWVRRALPSGSGTLTAVAIGADADLDTLNAMARGGGGVVLPFVPGQRLSEAAYGVLSATYGASLEDVRVELPPGLTEIAPSRMNSILAGGEELVVARMVGDRVEGEVKLTGALGGQRFERSYPVTLTATSERGNTFVPRLFAAAKIADLELQATDGAKQEAVKLSQRFNIASRHTSLLVLESPAMFKAFGLDNTRYLPEWSGDEEAVATAEVDADVLESPAQRRPIDLGYDDHRAASGSAAKAMPKPAAPPPRTSMEAPAPFADEARPMRRGGMIPMRRVHERVGVITTDRLSPKSATSDRIAAAEAELRADENRRDAVKKLYNLLAVSGELDRASSLAEAWSRRDPLDPEALTARADLLARSGDRDGAIRLLGSVIDVAPGDVAGQQRLARLYRWAGKPEQGCRFSLAIAQLRSDSKLLGEALRCARQSGLGWLADRLLEASPDNLRQAAQRLADAPVPEERLSGDLRVEVEWTGSRVDLDIALLHPSGHRVSWLGAPTRSVISASHVTSTEREGLALRAAPTGEYVIEVVRASGHGPVSGTAVVHAAGVTRRIPFTLHGDRATLGIAQITTRTRLVPASGPIVPW